MGSKISTSMVKIMAQIITAESAEVGMYAKCGVRKAHAAIIIRPVTQPPNVVWTPEAALMADRPNEAVIGMLPQNEPTNWHTPKATISCDASIFPLGAERKCKVRR